MNTIHSINVGLKERSYEILISPGISDKCRDHFQRHMNGETCLIITDSNVSKLYAEKIMNAASDAGSKVSIAEFPAGEPSKNIQTLGKLYDECVKAGLDRNSFIIALGGGVPGDIAGFVASSYMRGIRFIQVPTTLLAMVDSSVGGKTGIDLPAGKNLVGAFWQPKFVMIDPEFLKSLPEREVRCGLAEVVKYAMILDSEFFEKLESGVDHLNCLDFDFYSEVIAHCCRLKAHVVTEDEREGGLRAILNYGHTFAHAIEAISGYGELAHGEAVAIGMCMASDLAVELDLYDREMAKRKEALMSALHLPCRLKGYDPDQIYQAMFGDKKTLGGKIRLVLPDEIGKVSIHGGIDKKKIIQAIKDRID